MRFPLLARFFVLLVLLPGVAGERAMAQAPSQIENSRRANRSWVSDGADMLSDAEERRINAVSAALKSQNGAELEIVTVRSLNGKSVEEFSNDLFRTLGVGVKGRDNGVIILGVFDPSVPAGQRKSHIEVGYGLEGELPDGRATAIMREQVVPLWKAGDYGEGFYQGALAVAQVIEPAFTPPAATSGALPPVAQPDSSTDFQPDFAPSNQFPTRNPVTVYPAGGIVVALLGLLVFLFPLLIIGGIVWFFTAAMKRPLRCSKCRAPVQQLSDTAELASLSPVQQFEQQIGARDYRVWRCQNCHNEDITAHELPQSQFTQCPTCRHQTASILIETLRQPTQWQGGLERVILSCQWKDCKHANFYNRATSPTPRGYGGGYGRGYGGGADLLTGVVLGSILGNSHQSGGFGGGWSGGGSGGDSGGFDGGGGGFDSGPSDFGGGDSGGGGGSVDW